MGGCLHPQQYVLTPYLSGVKHLKEIEDAHLELPSINQIEVRAFLTPPCVVGSTPWEQLHPFCQQQPIVDYCKARNIFVQAYCPIIQGQQLDDPRFKPLADKVCRMN